MKQAPVEIEPRPYGPESSPEECRALRDCIYLFDDAVVMWKEVPIQTPFQIGLFGEELLAVTSGMDSFSLLIDLTEAKKPNAEVREALRRLFAAQTRIVYVAVFTGKNWLLNHAARFILGGSLGRRKFSVHKTRDEAVKAIRRQGREGGATNAGGILFHIAEITAGHCAIDDAVIAAESNREMREILSGLRFLHEDLVYRDREKQQALTNFSLIAETVEDVFWIADTGLTRVDYVSPAYERLWQRTCQSLYDNPASFSDPILAEDREKTLRWILERQAEGLPYQVTYRLRRSDGTIRWMSGKGNPVRDHQGRVVAYAGTCADISDYMEAEKRFDTLEQLNHHVIDGAPIGIAVYGADGACKLANPMLATVVGATEDQVRRQNFRRLKSWRENGFLETADEVFVNGISRYRSAHIQTSFGKVLWITAHFAKIMIDGEAHLLLLARDVTEWRAANERLNKLSMAVDQNPNMIFIMNKLGVIEYVNPSFTRTTGYSPEEAIGQTPRILADDDLPDGYYDDVRRAIDNGAEWRGDLQCRSRDGQVFFIAVVNVPIRNEHG
ncbi:MAG: PAS domain S-box protein, partial [Alphaproteobacteria bacterium]|nr:PAS domain S-box protein [Alphaproteobacteria bacterium]